MLEAMLRSGRMKDVVFHSINLTINMTRVTRRMVRFGMKLPGQTENIILNAAGSDTWPTTGY